MLLVEDGFLINWPEGKPHPNKEPWEYWLFVTEVKRERVAPGKWREVKENRVETITGSSRRDADRKLRAFVKRRGVRVIPTPKTPAPAPAATTSKPPPLPECENCPDYDAPCEEHPCR